MAVQDEIEIEIAEVLYGMMRMPSTSKQEAAGNDLTEAAKSTVEVKSRVSSPISNPQTLPQSSITLAANSSSSNVSAIGNILSPFTNRNDYFCFFFFFFAHFVLPFSLQLLRERSRDMSSTKTITVHASLQSNPKPKLLQKVKFRSVIN